MPHLSVYSYNAHNLLKNKKNDYEKASASWLALSYEKNNKAEE